MPGFGLIKHKTSGKFLHPSGGSSEPGDNTRIIIHSGNHYATTWAINTQSKTILHVGNKIWHPLGGGVTPGDTTPVIVHSGEHSATHFYPVDAYGNIPNINGAALTGGTWEKVYAVLNA